MKEAYTELTKLATHIFLPQPYLYNLWQPWLKGYNGERYIGYVTGYVWVQYVWNDQDLKQKMTGRR